MFDYPRALLATCLMFALPLLAGAADRPGFNTDESAVRPYSLPDPLVMNNGSPVRDAASWLFSLRPERRRRSRYSGTVGIRSIRR